jgi:DNA-binding CsgD family transcriptional regulator/tetratricopeptide (TPR) repeat protein
MVPSALESGLSALAAAQWQEAHDLLTKAVAESPTGIALEALGEACSWLDDTATIEVRERAYRCHRQEGDARGAARAAIALAFDHLTFRGEAAVGQGWLELAARALADVPLSPEHGHLAAWEADFAISIDGDPVVAAVKAAEAVRIGRELGIPDVELMGRAQEGMTLVLQGRISEGMRLLDSAAAAAMAGEIVDPAYAGYAVCYVINACEIARDSHRAAQWCLRLDAHCRKVGLQALQQICRSEYAGVLVEQGDWDRAEAEIMVAAEDLAGRRPGMAGEPLVRLAELRRRQGRTDEAAELFARAEGHPRALLGLAALALDLGDPAGAVALARRFIRQCSDSDRTFRSQGLEVLVAASAEAGDLEAARSALKALAAEGQEAARGAHRAGARLAESRLLLAEDRPQAAREAAEDAVDLYDRAGAPFGAARARAVLARVLLALGDEVAGLREADAAARAFEHLGARGEAERARAMCGASPPAGLLTPREVDVLRLVADGLGTAAIADRLVLSEHTVHRHVANTLTKLDVKTRAAAVSKASVLGLI